MHAQPNDRNARTGIPFIYVGGSWDRFDHDHDPLAYAIAYEAMVRLSGPLNWVNGAALSQLQNECKQHMAPEHYERVRQHIFLLDVLHCPMLDFVVQVCARVIPNLLPAVGTLEETLQAALAAGGLGSVNAANELVRSLFGASGTLEAMRRVWPDFDLEDLSIVRKSILLKEASSCSS